MTHCLVPRPGIEPWSSAVEVLSPNHWTAREVPHGGGILRAPLTGHYHPLQLFLGSLASRRGAEEQVCGAGDETRRAEVSPDPAVSFPGPRWPWVPGLLFPRGQESPLTPPSVFLAPGGRGSPVSRSPEAPTTEAAHHVGHAASGGLHPEPAALHPATPGHQGTIQARV